MAPGTVLFASQGQKTTYYHEKLDSAERLENTELRVRIYTCKGFSLPERFMADSTRSILPGYLFSSSADSRRWFLARILIGRLLVLGGVFLAASFLQPEYVPGFQLFIGISFLTLIPYSLWVKSRQWIMRAVSMQFLLDVVVTTGLIHYSGGISSPFFALYPLIILGSGLLVSASLALEITLLSSIFYGLIITLEHQGMLIYQGTAPSAYSTLSGTLVTGASRIFLFTFFGAASAYLSSFTAYQTHQIKSYTSMIETILDHIPAGIFAVFEDGKIAMANSAAGTLVAADPRSLRGRDFKSFFSQPDPSQAAPETAIRSQLKAPLDTEKTTPVLCICSETTIPQAFFQGPRMQDLFNLEKTSKSTASVKIWAIHDIAAEIEAERANRELTRLRTTEHVATELAHHVRNALTAINGASHMIGRTLPTGTATGTSDSENQQLLNTMQEIIESETDTLENKISKVLNNAGEDPAGFSDEAAELYERFVHNSCSKKN